MGPMRQHARSAPAARAMLPQLLASSPAASHPPACPAPAPPRPAPRARRSATAGVTRCRRRCTRSTSSTCCRSRPRCWGAAPRWCCRASASTCAGSASSGGGAGADVGDGGAAPQLRALEWPGRSPRSSDMVAGPGPAADAPPLPPSQPLARALRLLRLSLLEGNLPHMRLSQGALLAGAVNVPLLWLVASVMAWLFTSAAIVQVGGRRGRRGGLPASEAMDHDTQAPRAWAGRALLHCTTATPSPPRPALSQRTPPHPNPRPHPQVIEKMPWHDALYFVTTTLTTVGYGDVVVKSSVGEWGGGGDGGGRGGGCDGGGWRPVGSVSNAWERLQLSGLLSPPYHNQACPLSPSTSPPKRPPRRAADDDRRRRAHPRPRLPALLALLRAPHRRGPDAQPSAPVRPRQRAAERRAGVQ
jgi:hypothetical protein